MMDKNKALQILKQPDRVGCHLISAADEESCKYNQETIEAFNMAVSSIVKLNMIEQIVNKSYTEDEFYNVVCDIKKVLEQDNVERDTSIDHNHCCHDCQHLSWDSVGMGKIPKCEKDYTKVDMSMPTVFDVNNCTLFDRK